LDWTQALTIIVSVFGLFLVAIPYLISKMDANQKENNTRFNSIENRLTALESEVKNTNQRIDNTSQRITDLKTDINQRLSNIENCVMPRKVYRFEEVHRDDEEPKEN
jgi:peptidoglycan hydrolase CwlO-like protein